MTRLPQIPALVALVVGLTILGLALGGVGAGGYVWMNAPPVGGAFWPYIRVFAAVLAGLVGLKIGALIGYVTGFGLSAGILYVVTRRRGWE